MGRGIGGPICCLGAARHAKCMAEGTGLSGEVATRRRFNWLPLEGGLLARNGNALFRPLYRAGQPPRFAPRLNVVLTLPVVGKQQRGSL